MAAKGGIIENPYSWTKAGVNFMSLESPVGVGFSYCTNKIEQNNTDGYCYADDQTTAKMNKAALIEFFQLFPELEGGDFYISGTFVTRFVLRIHPCLLVLLSTSLGRHKQYYNPQHDTFFFALINTQASRMQVCILIFVFDGASNLSLYIHVSQCVFKRMK